MRRCSLVFAWVCLLVAPMARAQFAVIDVGAIAQLIAQAQTLEQQLATARDHLAQARADFDSTTGGRGMERLLGGIDRNYAGQLGCFAGRHAVWRRDTGSRYCNERRGELYFASGGASVTLRRYANKSRRHGGSLLCDKI